MFVVMSSTQEAHKSPPFTKCCGCNRHDDFTGDVEFPLWATSHLKRHAAYQDLVAQGMITRRKKYVWSSCLDYAKENLLPSYTMCSSSCLAGHGDQKCVDEEMPLATPPGGCLLLSEGMDVDTDDSTQLNETITGDMEKAECVKEHDEQNAIKLAFSLGQSISMDLFYDGKSQNYTECNLTQAVWLKERNPVLLSFLAGCTGATHDSTNAKKVNALVHCVEQILYARNLNVVTPFAFQRNLVQYASTKSRACTTLTGSWEPAGSYTTLHNFTCAHVDTPQCPCKSDFHITIDNNQKVSRSSGTYISEGSSVPAEVCTTVGYLVPGFVSDLQKDPSLKPSVWQDSMSIADKLEKVDIMECEAMGDFREYRCRFMQERLQEVIVEQSKSNEIDHIDLAVRNVGVNAVCSKCRFVYPQQQDLVCPRCKHDAVHFPLDYDPYHRTETHHPEYPAVMQTGDPCLVNPNSIKMWRSALTIYEMLLKFLLTGNGLCCGLMAFLIIMCVSCKTESMCVVIVLQL